MDRMRLVGLGFFAVTALVVALTVATTLLGGDEPQAALETGSDGAVGIPTARASGGGTGESLGIKGYVEFIVYDADGNVKERSGRLNATLDGFLNDASSRLAAATTTAEAHIYENIQLCTGDTSGASCSIVDLDEDSNPTDFGPNPADTTPTLNVDAGGGDTVGTYEAQNLFTCTATGDGACTTIQEIQLAKGAAVDGTPDTAGAWQDVNTTLNDGDTIQITWTVDID